MFTKTTGWVIVPLWLAAMSWLFAHDVLPGWTAQEAPTLLVSDWLRQEGNRAQFAIFHENRQLGTIWTRYLMDAGSIQRRDLVWIDRFPVQFAPLRMIADSTFTADGVLDELTVRIENDQGVIRLHGERFHADFSFTLDSNWVQKTFKLPLVEGGIVAPAFNPFAQLSDLRVGQRWRMQAFNPVAALTGFGKRFIPMLVEVTGEERIVVGNSTMLCKVVEAPNAKAWVDEHGAVQVQEMTLPAVGTIRVVRETGFDEQGRRLARTRKFTRTGASTP